MKDVFQSDLLAQIKPAAALAIAAKASQKRAEGVPVINLALGEPDFATPNHVIEAAIQAMRNGETRYTVPDGTAALKDAVVHKFKRDNNLSFSKENISCANGAKQSIYNVLLATLNLGDEVIFSAPHWVSYSDASTLAGGIPKALTSSAQNGFKLTPDLLEAAITPQSRWVILNSPGNPSGSVYTSDEYAALGDVLRRYPRVLIMSDEIYEHINYLDDPFVSFGQACPDLLDRTVIVNGVAKAYAMTGWRIGYIAAPAPLAAVVGKIQSQTTANPCSISQAAAIAALIGPQDFIQTSLAAYRKRRKLMGDGLERAFGRPQTPPDGAFYFFPSITELLGKQGRDGRTFTSDMDIADYLLDQAHVACVPGSAFGLPGHIRFSFATSPEDVQSALSKVESSLSTRGTNR
ncbi:pyridoxal phosphate-dependent aminotransferase [Roseinatronobacter alkalisoli]|uniref:Aminotransferase n=1 Tax=Roseinatronobacter alkalisoli TaxID=3028235 RepID=A0ABT5TEH5_9RHOB|nr:pyridoxal phosphate-dependent aminotransferase [Roseinatronobacter sp. HJB301]MDD7973528.1 pyridoxal phosphate-dependent aminotransferase [Roseinatronobacter sp. HJB301]